MNYAFSATPIVDRDRRDLGLGVAPRAAGHTVLAEPCVTIAQARRTLSHLTRSRSLPGGTGGRSEGDVGPCSHRSTRV
jgi:hypothetical protein